MLNMDVGIFVLRLLIGLLIVGHGARKLFGWFGGKGLQDTTRWMESMNFRPPRFWAVIAGLGEFLGGLGLTLGLYTPISSALLIGALLMAILKVHWSHGLWASNNGFEYPLVNLVVTAFLGLWGPGLYALDRVFNLSYPTPTTFTVALLVVIAGVIIALATTAHQATSVRHQTS